MNNQEHSQNEIHLPAPSAAPIVLAAGMTIAGAGLVVPGLVIVVGIILVGVGIGLWVFG